MKRALVLVVALSGCARSRSDRVATIPPPSAAASVAPSRRETIRILYTADEHGWAAPAAEKGRKRGGVAELFARWRQIEHHCIATSKDDCRDASDLALSGGDNWTGPAISSFFHGAVMAEAMRRIGYAASAFGNHELDFGRAVFDENAKIEGFPYLGANVSPVAPEGVSKPFALFERRGVKIGVVGLAHPDTPKVGLRDHYRGLSFGDIRRALERAVPAAYDAGADVVVVIAHVCVPELDAAIKPHPEWHLAFVGGGHCHKSSLQREGDVPIVEPGAFLRQYVRATITVDLGRPPRDRVVRSDVEMVDLTEPESEPPPVVPDPELAKIVSDWQKKTDDALGEVVGYTNETFESDTPPMTNLITDAWRIATGADVAILNRFATRQAIQKGPITLETIYSVLPFDNHLVTVHITGKDLVADVRCCGGHVSGVEDATDGSLVLAGGKPIDPTKTYTVVSTDYAYLGGSNFPFAKQDPNGAFGVDWRDPLVAWFKSHPTSKNRGLETLVDRKLRVAKPKTETH